MSVHVLSWVLKHSPVDDPQARLILLVLADHADDVGCHAFPKRETIAAESKVPLGTVGHKLADLRAGGHIEEMGRRGYNNRTVVWRVKMAQAIQSQRPESNPMGATGFNPGQSDGGRPDQSDRRRLDSRVEASREPSEPSTDPDGSGRGRAGAGWDRILALVAERGELTDFMVHAWLQPLVPLDAAPGRLVLGAPGHVRGWVRERFLPILQDAAAEVAGHPVEIVLMPMLGEGEAA